VRETLKDMYQIESDFGKHSQPFETSVQSKIVGVHNHQFSEEFCETTNEWKKICDECGFQVIIEKM
jgi:hypothetical protein